MVSPIPVLGAPVVNGPHWIHRLLTSIDYPVDTFVVINNNGREQIDKELDALKGITNPFVRRVHVTHMPANIGCAGAWNLIIKSFIQAPHWVIANHDVMFLPGFLQEMAEKAANPATGFIHGIGWDIFLLKDWVIERCGLFDENYYPAYCEDADYDTRMKLCNIPRARMEHEYYHGATLDGKKASRTTHDEPKLATPVFMAHELNKAYTTKKWGEAWQAHIAGEVFPTPFNVPQFPVYFTKYDLKFVRKKHLGF